MREILENEIRINHRIIAENTQIQQKNIIELINKYQNELATFGQLPFKTESVKNTAGAINQTKTYYLNEQQATLLITFMRNNKIVINFKVKLVSEFFKMREHINNQPNTNKVYVTLSDSKVREAFFIAFDGKCYYSKESLTKTHFHIDHILPKSKGGEDILSNLVLCKSNINQIKSDSYDENFVNHHQNIVNKNYAPKIEAILNLLEDNKILDLKYLFNSGVMNKLEDLYGRETIKELYANLIPNLNYKKSQKIETKTTEYFIKNCIISTKGSRLSTINLYQNYLNFCEDNQISEYSKIRFFQLFRDLKNMPKNSNLRVGYFNGKRQRYFKNLEIVL